MRRLTSVCTHVLMTALALFVAVPATAQSTPAPRANTVRPSAMTAPPINTVERTFQQEAIAPTRPAQGQQAGQGQQAIAPPAVAPRPPSAPNIGDATNRPMPQATNIRFELTVTDTLSGAPVKKNVSWLVLNGHSGMIRTTNTSTGFNAFINVDAVATAYQNGQVSTRITFEYSPAAPKDGTNAGSRPPSLNESITVVLQDGKPMMLSQSADPVTDRKVTAELTATILK